MLGRLVGHLSHLRRTACGERFAFAVVVAAAVVPSLAPAPFLQAACAQYGPVDPHESAIRVLRGGVRSSNPGRQHETMMALRELRDPSTRELLVRLLKADAAPLRIDSVLGLAEIDPARKIDPKLVAGLTHDNERDLALEVVLKLELVDKERIETMLAWDDLDQAQRAALLGELRRLGGEPNRADLAKLVEAKSPVTAGFGLAVLLDLAAPEAQQATDRVRAAIAELAPRSRSECVAEIARFSSINGLKGAAPFVASLLELPELSGDPVPLAMGSLLVLDPERGYAVFARAVEADRSQRALMRNASILLASGARAPSSEWNRVRNGDALIETIADAGSLMTAGKDAEAYAKLVALKHRVTLRAALEGARRLGPSADRELGLACLALLEGERRALGPLAESVVGAVVRLAVVAPEELRPILERTTDDPELQDIVLKALCAAGTRDAAQIAATVAGKASRLGDSLIAILQARNSAEITAEQLQLLANVAGGAVPVDSGLQVQAAWLWLKHASRLGDAVDLIVSLPSNGETRAEDSAAQESATR